MRPFVVLLVMFAAGRAAASEAPCPGGEPGPGVDPRRTVATARALVVGYPAADFGSPATDTVRVWEAGEAPWSHVAAMFRSGAVSVRFRRDAVPGACLRSPRPVAYGGFGAQVVADADALAVLEARTGRVYLYDVRDLSLRPSEARPGRAESLGIAPGLLFVGGRDGIDIVSLEESPRSVAHVDPAPGAAVFSGQIAGSRDILVWANPGLGHGDSGPLGPGRVDVFRRAQDRWLWEGRLAPEGLATNQGFGDACCVSVEGDRVSVSVLGKRYVFARLEEAWRQVEGPR